jgi:hypothetical protein
MNSSPIVCERRTRSRTTAWSYERTGASVFFDEAQGQRIGARVRAYVRSGELLPIVPPWAGTSERSEGED